MNQKIEEHLKKYCESNSRWWTNYTKVVDIDGMIIGFQSARTTGDDSHYDKGWSFKWESVKEYTFTEETVVVKKYKPVE